MKNNRGFSLVEVIIVICLLGLLGGIAVPNLTGTSRNSKVQADKILGAQIGNAFVLRETDGYELVSGEQKKYTEYPNVEEYVSTTLRPDVLKDGYYVITTIPHEGTQVLMVGITKNGIKLEDDVIYNGKNPGWVWCSWGEIEDFFETTQVYRKIKLVYNANGGSGAPNEEIYTLAGSETSKTITLSNQQPTRNNYDFLGWSTNSTATTASYNVGGKYTISNDLNLHAVWKIRCAHSNTTKSNYTSISSTEHTYLESCNNCDWKETKTASHVYDKQKVESKYKASDATCTESAKYYKSCICGAKGSTTFSSGSTLEHSWSNGKCTGCGTSSGTCGCCGNYNYNCSCTYGCSECSRCTEYHSDYYVHDCGKCNVCCDCEIHECEFTGSTATCTESGYSYCECGNKLYESALGHNWYYSTSGNCLTTKMHKCSVCKIEEDSGDYGAHSTYSGVCDICKQTIGRPACSHSSTTTESKVVDSCGQVLGAHHNVTEYLTSCNNCDAVWEYWSCGCGTKP